MAGGWHQKASMNGAALTAQLARLESVAACPPCPEQPKCEVVEKQQGGCDLVGKYDLSHLTQPANQDVGGPVQDDEALFLYSVVRGLRLQRVLEVGGKDSYSARNFLAAMEPTQGIVYTVDIVPAPPVEHSGRHKILVKNARHLNASDVDNLKLDMVFFDCHLEDVQMDMYISLLRDGIVDDNTLLAFHDTNTHPVKMAPWAVETADGWVHQAPERRMVNKFHDMGWDALMLHPQKSRHNPAFPYRHGLVIMAKFKRLLIPDQEVTSSAASD